MSNSLLATYAERAARLDDARREAAEDLKELYAEAKSAGLSSDDIAGIKQALRERHWDADKQEKVRKAAEAAKQVLGLPLFAGVS